MHRVSINSQKTVAVWFTAYLSAQGLLASSIKLLDLEMPGLWWALLALPPSWLLISKLEIAGHQRQATAVRVFTYSFLGGSIGAHIQEILCKAIL